LRTAITPLTGKQSKLIYPGGWTGTTALFRQSHNPLNFKPYGSTIHKFKSSTPSNLEPASKKKKLNKCSTFESTITMRGKVITLDDSLNRTLSSHQQQPPDCNCKRPFRAVTQAVSPTSLDFADPFSKHRRMLKLNMNTKTISFGSFLNLPEKKIEMPA